MSARRGNRRGFTFIEILIVMVVFGILTSIASLKYIDIRRNAVAAKVASELNAVKLAGYDYWAEHQAWPADAGPGVVPAPLVRHLPSGFRFADAQWDYTLEWDNFGIVSAPGSPPGYMLGITVATGDLKLMRKLEQYLGKDSPFYAFGGRLTYVIMAPGGGF